MNSKQRIALLVVVLLLILGIVVLMARRTSRPGQDTATGTNELSAIIQGVQAENNISFDQAADQAREIIKQRTSWPESPVAVCKAFWTARADKDYDEMKILWPGSASFDWPEICKDDPKVEYVFGEARSDGTQVPYVAKEYFDKNHTYNLTMHLSRLNRETDLRYYIVSGN